MDCNVTSSISNKRSAAMTLVEMLVAMGVGSILFAVLGSLAMYSARNFSSLLNYSDLNKESRMALDEMSRDIRQSRGLISRNDTNLTFAVNTGQLSYTYDRERQVLLEHSSGTSKTILNHCTFWTNEIFQRNPQPEMTFIPTTDPAQCKMVQMSWVCDVRSGLSVTNSDSVQSMKVVIRKKPD